MARRLPKHSTLPHRLIRLVAFLLFALSLVVILLLHQPQTDADIGQGRATQTAQDKYPEKALWVRFTSDPVAILTLGLVAVGAAQAILFVQQLSLIRKSLADTKKAAKAAKRQSVLARATLIASHRSWIKIDISVPTFNINFSTASFSMKFDIKITNVGNSPAQQVIVGPLLHHGKGQSLESTFATYKGWVANEKHRGIFLFPKEFHIKEETTHINFADFAEIGSDALMIACFYKDGVDDIWRETSFVELFAISFPAGGLPKSKDEILVEKVWLSRFGPMTTIS